MKIIDEIKIDDLLPLINKKWLFAGLWQLKGSVEEGERAFKEFSENVLSYGYEPKIIFEGYDAEYKDGNLSVFKNDKQVAFEFNDLIFKKFSGARPLEKKIHFLAATVGEKIGKTIEEKRAAGQYKDYFYLTGFASALAEALTEFGHQRICEDSGWERDKSFRLSPGYPAWPDLKDQIKIKNLLSFEKIGLDLSESFQLHPEFSTTSMVFFIKK